MNITLKHLWLAPNSSTNEATMHVDSLGDVKLFEPLPPGLQAQVEDHYKAIIQRRFAK